MNYYYTIVDTRWIISKKMILTKMIWRVGRNYTSESMVTPTAKQTKIGKPFLKKLASYKGIEREGNLLPRRSSWKLKCTLL